MNTPPPDATPPAQSTPSTANGTPANSTPTLSVALDDDDFSQTPPPQPLTPSMPANKCLHGYLGDDEDESPLALLLRTVDFAAFVSYTCHGFT